MYVWQTCFWYPLVGVFGSWILMLGYYAKNPVGVETYTPQRIIFIVFLGHFLGNAYKILTLANPNPLSEKNTLRKPTDCAWLSILLIILIQAVNCAISVWAIVYFGVMRELAYVSGIYFFLVAVVASCLALKSFQDWERLANVAPNQPPPAPASRPILLNPVRVAAPVIAAPAMPSDSGDAMDRMGSLNQMLYSGLITQAEFDVKKKQILDQM
jgi:hypothetical protein